MADTELHFCVQMRLWHHFHIRVGQVARMENWKNLNISILISQRSYQIRRKTRWYLVGIDRPIFSKINLKEAPTDNNDIGQSVGEHVFVKHVGTNHEQWVNMLELKSINNYFRSSHHGEITLYLDRKTSLSMSSKKIVKIHAVLRKLHMIQHMTTLTMWPIVPSPMCPITQGAPSLSSVLTMIPICPHFPYVKKDVKLSKRCQKVKHMNYGGGSQKKINWHNEVHTY